VGLSTGIDVPEATDSPVDLHFTRTNGPVDDAIDRLMATAGGIHQPDIVREMMLAALKAGQENPEKADLKLMNSTLKEMRFTAKIFGPFRQQRKVSVFGSARTATNDPSYAMAVDLGKRLAHAGFMVITGGGPGIMQAVNEGAGAEHSFGINIRLPFEQKPNPIVDGNPKSINYKYFFNRKVAFLKEADAVVLFPGGYGTLDEAMETLTLIQTGKRDPMPVIMVSPGESVYWKEWLAFVKNRLEGEGFIGDQDTSLFRLTDSLEAVVEDIRGFYRRYHSLRYVGNTLVLRLLSEPSPETLERARQDFKDLLVPGGRIRPGGPLPDESDTPAIMHLPRLLVDFNRTRFARLRAFIDFINANP
jgi:uncharacterized protein (TIGR00730 family)